MNTPRYQHLPFYKLKTGEDFFHGKMRYYKSSHVMGRTILDGEPVFIMPWTKVRSARPFGKQPPSLYSTELQTLTGKGPIVEVPLSQITKGSNNFYFGNSTVAEVRPPRVVEGGDRSSETIGGSELTPSS